MTQVKNLWLNEYDNISMWECDGQYSVQVQYPVCTDTGTGIEEVYITTENHQLWYDRQTADNLWAAEVACWV